jgi:hypothetical protein
MQSIMETTYAVLCWNAGTTVCEVCKRAGYVLFPVRPFHRAGWHKVYTQFCDAFSACPWVLQNTLAAFPSILPVHARERCAAAPR